MKLKLLLLTILILIGSPVFAQCTGVFTIFTEDFEDHGNTANGGSGRYTSLNDFHEGQAGLDDDYWGRIEGTTTNYFLTNASSGLPTHASTAYVGWNGEFYYAGEDMDDIGGIIGSPDGLDEKEISFTGINISGATNMCFSGLFARGENDPCGISVYDDVDYIRVFYNVDGAGEVLAMQFAPDIECNIPGDITNEPLHHDPNFDGDGGEGTELTNLLSEFTFNIPNGTSLDLRIEVHMDASSEEIAIDYLRIRSDSEVLGILEQTLEQNIFIYPNPSDGKFKLKVNNSTQLNHAVVYNLFGKSIKSFNLSMLTNEIVLDLTELSSGIYIIQIQSIDGHILNRKLIIN